MSTPAGAPAPVAAPGRVLLVVAAAVFLASLDLFIVNVAFPDIAASFDGASVSSLSWVLNAYAIVFAALLVPAGRFADLVGRRRAFLLGLGVFVGASALCALAWSVPSLVGFRVLQALGAALLMPSSLALLLDAYPPAGRAKAIGAWAAAGGVAAALGPPVGGVLVELSWRWVFLVNVPFGVAAVVAGVRILRESRDELDRRRPDLVGAAVLVAGVGLLCWGLVDAPDDGWGDPRTLGRLGVGVLMLVAVVLRSRTVDGRRAPVLELALFRQRPFALATLSALLFSVAFAAMLLNHVLLMTGPWRASVLTAGLSLAPGPLMAAVFATSSGGLGDRIGQGRRAVLGNLVFALGCAWWLWRVGPEQRYVTEVLPGMLLSGIGVGLFLPSVSTAVAATLTPQRLASGSAILSAARQLGTVGGVAVLVAVLGTGAASGGIEPFRDGWTMMLAAALLAGVAAAGIGPDPHPASSDPEGRTGGDRAGVAAGPAAVAAG
ncbi:MFS transporter [Patulibacter americanus]|uniref:MFS transporter n=1 Tax=Patulibacter americanus TaxID=588672 RepID=UPI001FE217D6|nr:MFS transporter [Patulibacter americanus]